MEECSSNNVVVQSLPEPWTPARLDVPDEAPAELVGMVGDFAPPVFGTTSVIDPWRAQALAGVLGVEPPAEREGDPLPLGWQEVYFRDPIARGTLAEDGHAADHALMPTNRPRRRVFGGATMDLTTPLRVGDEVTRLSLLEDCRIRPGRTGWLLVLTELHAYTTAENSEISGSQDGLALTERRKVVLRYDGAAPAQSGPRADRTPPPRPEPEITTTLTPDPVTLFRFSALTYNPHRIHYDHRYATGVEGHADLVVHGPLSALLLLDVARRATGPKPLTHYDFSLLTPAYVDRATTFTASRDDEGWTLTGTQKGRRIISGNAH
ncbi:hypothetical protein BAY61_15180 [Prauserella marina]|uniref:3-methylfumaryl-CoA hydratase n=1 Tax=Prauserella marina TaxID=530584 RepID=A0A222VQB2_9PSEU|nr:hypothetical protein [Prauserella marina]ASR36126.1 hypothetical protein BAY61_15180 [Prauserella marina]PWV76863.1 3-methylfumaryl-CoA hydratase [Prauserella marina]SDC99266.1 3-methylfumaryl-CoA hydratase [Prauserella marina]